MPNLDYKFNDGGSKFKPRRDCVVRAISIATKQDYMDVLKHFTVLMDKPAYRGVPRKIYDLYLKNLGWVWTPTMFIGSGCKVHMNKDELPKGTLILRTSKHLTCVIDHVINDTYDPSRDGNRCVYGYWRLNEK